MPFGHPEATEALWCVTCGATGHEYAFRRQLGGCPTPRVRICPPCAGLEGGAPPLAAVGWQPVGAWEAGRFYVRRRNLPAGQNPEPAP